MTRAYKQVIANVIKFSRGFCSRDLGVVSPKVQVNYSA